MEMDTGIFFFFVGRIVTEENHKGLMGSIRGAAKVGGDGVTVAISILIGLGCVALVWRRHNLTLALGWGFTEIRTKDRSSELKVPGSTDLLVPCEEWAIPRIKTEYEKTNHQEKRRLDIF